MMWWDHGGWGGGWGAGDWLAMSVMMVVFWGLLIAVVVWVVRSFRREPDRPTTTQPAGEDADTVLAARFARGEIDDDEFTRRRDLLRGGSRRS